MRLIITEKNNSAQKIAEILSDGSAKETKSFTVPVFRWEDSEGETAVIGTGGHFVGREFPQEKEYKQWKLDLIPGLIDAPLETGPIDGKKNVIKAVQKEAKAADSLVIGTDFDREGELIGLEALEVCLAVNPDLESTLKRARYSALTREEIEGAFNNLDQLSFPLANAAGARQDIDLIWGAAFTRAVSLIAKAYGATLVAQYEICMWANAQGVEQVEPMNTGGCIESGGVRYCMVPAFHSAAVMRDGTPMAMGDPAGFVLQVGGRSIYHTGDTALFSDMALIQRLYRPKVGLVCIGDRFTMGPEAAAIACNEFLDLELIVPIHWGTFNLARHTWADPVRRVLPSAQSNAATVLIPPPGGRIDLVHRTGDGLADPAWWERSA